MKQKALLSFFFLLCFGFAWSQNRQVSGRVTRSDNAAEGIPGVTVTIKGTATATSTDNNGHFSIRIPDRNNVVLQFSSVGFGREEVAVRDRNSVDVTLSAQASTLNDVVVIGYGTARKKDITGATSSIGAAQLEKIPVSNVAEALTGRLPGVQVTTTDGAPGAEIVIRVRGGGSITQDNSPLYIVDGFQVASINDIAPSDIASIDILKDAASSAIYGSRGANGVVQITTKSAKAGKTSVNYNGFVQARTLPRKLQVLSPYEYVLAQYEFARVQNQTAVDNFSKLFGTYEDLELYKRQEGTDWQQKLFGNPALSQQHSININGGTDKTKVSFGYTMNKDEGLMPNSGYLRNYFSLKLAQELGRNLKFDLNSRYSNAVTDGAGTSGSSQVRISDGITTRPVNGLADQIVLDPNAAGSGDEYEDFLRSLVNPLALAEQDYRKRVNKVFNGNAALAWTIRKGLTFRTEGGLDLNTGNIRRYYGPLTSEAKNVGGNLPIAELTTSELHSYRNANTLNYQFRPTGKTDLNLLAGQEILVTNVGFSQFNRTKSYPAYMTPEDIFSNLVRGTVDQNRSSDIAGERLASFFGRAIYSINDKYIINVVGRYDGSSKFAPGNRWGFFPSASFAWRVSQEEFMKNINVVSDLKFRVSYGAAGNNRISDDAWRRTYLLSDVRPIGFGEQGRPYWTFGSSILDNPDLKWETTITRNLGLDFGLWANRISGAFDLYWNTTKDLLVQSAIPSQTGFSNQMRNIGQTSNRGVELSFQGTIINNKNFTLSGNFNIGINRARIDKLDGVNERAFNSNWAGTDLKQQDDYRLLVGETIGLIYGHITDGYYKTSDFESYDPATGRYTLKPGVPTAAAYLGGPIGIRPGALKLRDLDGNDTITAADRTYIGSALPKHTGGFGLNATFKGFDVSTFFNWVAGNDVYNTGRIAYNQYYRTTYGNMLNTMNSADRFKYIDASGNLVTDLAQLEKLNANAKMWSPFSFGNAVPIVHSYAIEDGSFLRLNNVTLGYSLPKNLISRLKMSKLRAYVTVYNALLFTNYSGYDPEVSATRSSSYAQLTPGVDYSAYPKSRSYTGGLQITF